MRPTILAVAVALVASSVAQAQTQLQLNQDAYAAYQAADRDLNRLYAQVRARLSPPARTALRTSQRQWIGFRDAECSFRALSVEGGSAAHMVRAGCLETLTRERVTSLREVTVNCQEGDLACFRIP